MAIKERFFLVGGEWNVIHLPRKPNGFAIFIIGDVNHYVKNNTSSWHQRPDQYQFIEQLIEAGYTVVYSNLFGRNWGSDDACQFLQRIYREVLNKEILNKKVHVIAEGMGALVAAKVLPYMATSFRSVVMINPCLNLKQYFNTEKKNKLFYKRFLKELKEAYNVDEREVEAVISSLDLSIYKAMPIPLKILHCLDQTPYTLEQHVRPYEQICNENKSEIELSIFLEDKSFQRMAKPTIHFFKKHEKSL